MSTVDQSADPSSTAAQSASAPSSDLVVPAPTALAPARGSTEAKVARLEELVDNLVDMLRGDASGRPGVLRDVDRLSDDFEEINNSGVRGQMVLLKQVNVIDMDKRVAIVEEQLAIATIHALDGRIARLEQERQVATLAGLDSRVQKIETLGKLIPEDLRSQLREAAKFRASATWVIRLIVGSFVTAVVGAIIAVMQMG